jgi:uncharacterized membrane protein YphA (DoxX/SURF4 family)
VSQERPRTALQWLARFGLSAMFLYAGALKLGDTAAFAADISHYRVLPSALVPALAVGLPVLEIVAAVALLTPTFAQGGALLCALMLGVFAAGMAQAKLRGIDLDCGCFGAASTQKVSWAKVALNAALAILAGWIASTSRSRRDTTPAAAPPSAQPG